MSELKCYLYLTTGRWEKLSAEMLFRCVMQRDALLPFLYLNALWILKAALVVSYVVKPVAICKLSALVYVNYVWASMQRDTRKHELSRLRWLMRVQRDASIPIHHCQHSVWFLTFGWQLIRFCLLDNIIVLRLFDTNTFLKMLPFKIPHSCYICWRLGDAVVSPALLLLLVHPCPQEDKGLLVWLDFHLSVFKTVCIRAHWYMDMYVNVLMFHIECLPITVLCCVYFVAF